MKKANSKLKNVTTKIAMVSIIVFPLVALMHATFAWFLAQRNVNNGINGIVATLPNKVIDKLYVFQEEKSGEANNYRHYDTKPSAIFDVNKNQWTKGGNDPDKLGLGTYSSLYPFHSSLMVLKVNENATSEDINKFTLNIVTGTIYDKSLVYRDTNSNATINTNGGRNLLQPTGNPLSSIVTFNYASTRTEILETDEFDGKKLNSTYSDFSNNLDPGKLINATFKNSAFYTMNKNNDGVDVYSEKISIVDPNSQNNQSIISKDTKYLVIIVEYFNEGLQYIYSLNIGNPNLEPKQDNTGDNTISFICDWSIVGQ